ncbi:hypothetical protein EDD85DRAFT_352922 [Armillaria nabsnona]|nr:hypothetical protein EDD85DRAFT_352922 [Armillaria nabsnona]
MLGSLAASATTPVYILISGHACMAPAVLALICHRSFPSPRTFDRRALHNIKGGADVGSVSFDGSSRYLPSRFFSLRVAYSMNVIVNSTFFGTTPRSLRDEDLFQRYMVLVPVDWPMDLERYCFLYFAPEKGVHRLTKEMHYMTYPSECASITLFYVRV